MDLVIFFLIDFIFFYSIIHIAFRYKMKNFDPEYEARQIIERNPDLFNKETFDLITASKHSNQILNRKNHKR